MLAYKIGDLTKAWKATEIKFYMQAPASLQAPIISNQLSIRSYTIYVCTCLCEIHCMGIQDLAQD